jgi:hypothetical protein
MLELHKLILSFKNWLGVTAIAGLVCFVLTLANIVHNSEKEPSSDTSTEASEEVSE